MLNKNHLHIKYNQEKDQLLNKKNSVVIIIKAVQVLTVAVHHHPHVRNHLVVQNIVIQIKNNVHQNIIMRKIVTMKKTLTNILQNTMIMKNNVHETNHE